MAGKELPQVIFLGTNGWYDTAVTGNTICTLVKTAHYDIVLDAGNGIYKLNDYCDGRKPVFILLSHFHIDHIVGLHILVKHKFIKNLTICGGKGARKILNTFVNKPFTVPLKALPYPVKVLELPSEKAKLPFYCETLPLVHADPVLGYRLQVDGKVISYVTDTGYCDNVVKLARGADLVISECAHSPGEVNPGWPHFEPATVGKLGAESGAKKVVMTHMSADRYRDPAARAAALKIARGIFPKTFTARDGMSLVLR